MSLEELRKRVEACGAGGDREIDAEIACALDGYDSVEVVRDAEGLESDAPIAVWVVTGIYRDDPDYYTSSLDAALALVERKLPGWTWVVGMGPEFARASLSDVRDFRERHTEAHAPTPALALIAALLKAQSESLGRPEA